MTDPLLVATLSATLDRWAAGADPPGLWPACTAVLWLSACGELEAAGSARERWGTALLGTQQPAAEYFGSTADPETSQLALQALDALHLTPRAWPPLPATSDPAAWLAALDWSQTRAAAASVSLHLQWLVLHAEQQANAEAMACFHSVLAWLDQAQDPETGLWGSADAAALSNSLLATSRLLAFFDYVRWPISHARQRLDLALLLLEQEADLAPALAAGLAGLVAMSHEQFDYRRGDIVTALKMLETAQTKRVSAQSPSDSFDAEAGWCVAFIRALLAHLINPYKSVGWTFARRPGPGSFARAALTAHERETLPHWISRLWQDKTQTPASVASPPTVTVVIPVFNLGRYLPEAVASVHGQVYQDYELIVVDDGSTDEYTRLLLDHWPCPRASLLRQPNQGVAVARNHAISVGAGRYVCCLDADDRLRPGYLERAVTVLDNDPEVGFVSGYMQMFDGAQTQVSPPRCTLPEMLAQNTAFQPAVFRRTAWEAAGGYFPGFQVSGIEDWDLWISLLDMGYRSVVLPEVIFDYRVRPDSMTARMHVPEHWARLMAQLIRRHPALYQQHLESVLTLNAQRIAELKAWAESREQSRAWWERQAQAFQRNSERLERLLAEQIDWTRQLQASKDWLEQQWRAASPLTEQTHD